MNRRVFTILMGAFVVAAVCSYLVYRVVATRFSAPIPSATRVVVAASNIKLGSVLRESDLTTTQMMGTLPRGVLLRKEDAIGRGVVSDIYEGEPVVASRLAAVGSGGGLAATIRQGMRACAIKVDDVVGVGGFVTPGMRVDVLISGNPPGAAGASDGTKVKTLLQNVEVLSAGTDIQKDAEGKPRQVQVVNLLVTPGDAELLSLASNQTKIQLVLRNPLDTDIAHPPGTAMANLFLDKNAPPPVVRAQNAVVSHKTAAAPVDHTHLIEVFNGSKKTEAKFPGEEKQ